MPRARSKKTFYLVANWKMNKTAREAHLYMEELLPSIEENSGVDVWFSVPFTTLAPASKILEGKRYSLGAQNMNDARPGSFTGEIAAEMIQDAGSSFVLIGHSERRRFFHETDELINRKMVRAFETQLIPILCVGETLEERDAERTESVIESQIRSAFCDIDINSIKKKAFMVAYEPVWAIGTGKSATPEIVEATHTIIQELLKKLMPRIGADISLLYGGSVSEKNAGELCTISNVNGFLIGTSSLQPGTFARIVHICDELQ